LEMVDYVIPDRALSLMIKYTMDKKELQQEISKAVAWLATEHNYFLELKKDISKLKTEIERAKANADLNGLRFLLRDVRYIGKAERRFNRYEHNVESILSKAKDKIKVSGTITEVEELIRRLHLEAADLVNSSSMYEGRLHDLLVHLQAAIKSKELEQAHQCLMELSELVENTEKWIAALSTDLNEAKKLSEESEIVFKNLEEINSELNRLTYRAQCTYLISLIRKKRSVSPKIYEGIKKIAVDVARRGIEGFFVAKALEDKEDFEEAASIYVKNDEHKLGSLKDNEWVIAGIRCYENAEKLELAMELALSRNYLSEAIRVGEIISNQKKTIDAFERLSSYVENHVRANVPNDYLDIIHTKAAKMLEKFGSKENAKKMWVRAAGDRFRFGDYKLALKALRKSGMSKENTLVQLGNYFFKGNRFVRAAEAYERAKEWRLAGNAWDEAGNGQKATEAYRKVKRY